MALTALVADGGRPDSALGVVAGAGLMAFSYRIIRQGVDASAHRARGEAEEAGPAAPERRSVASAAWTLTKYVTRYGVIAVMAWVVLVPLHAHPVWMFAGVSVPVVAIAVEAIAIRFPGGSS